MKSVTPEYDTATNSWFLPANPAVSYDSLAEIKAELNGDFVIANYYPFGYNESLNRAVHGGPSSRTDVYMSPLNFSRPKRPAVATVEPTAKRTRNGNARILKKLTPEQYDIILDLWSQSVTGPAIAKKLEIEYDLVEQLVIRARGEGDKRAVYHGGKSPKLKAEALAVTALIDRGYTNGKICRELSLTVGQVSGIRYRYRRLRPQLTAAE